VIILDTNVISEVMRPTPNAAVAEWLRGRPLGELATTTVTVAETRYGLARLAPGRRRADLEAKFANFLGRGFANRIFSFDALAAEAYGELVAARERAGRRLDGFDGLIAAIARSRGFALATRDVEDFADCGIEVFAPWG